MLPLPGFGEAALLLCRQMDNRTAMVYYGTDGAMVLDDTVLNWRNTGTCGD